MDMVAQLLFAKPQDFWDSVLWTNEAKVEFGLNGQYCIWKTTNTAFEQMNLIPIFKHGGGGMMILSCFVATGPVHLPFISSTMNTRLF